jgi:hypothetical protein
MLGLFPPPSTRHLTVIGCQDSNQFTAIGLGEFNPKYLLNPWQA